MAAQIESKTGKTWFGHPRGLAVLFNAELWERFSYYGMRALLVLYVVDALDYEESEAYTLYAAYGAIVYAFGVLGGWVAQRHLGELRAIVLGGVLMALGHLVMAIPAAGTLYLALALLCVGNGLFKPNVSTCVGALYAKKDPRRAQAFYVFYMGINIGAMLAPLACGAVADQYGWHLGFGLAGVGMLLGLAILVRGRQTLGAKTRTRPSESSWVLWLVIIGAAVGLCALLLRQAHWGHLVIELACVAVLGLLLKMIAQLRDPAQRQDRRRLIALVVLMLFHASFWAAFEQIGSSFTVLAVDHVDRFVLGVELPATTLVAVNGAMIIAFAWLVSRLWERLGERGLEPSTPAKFALGLGLLGAGFLVFVVGIHRALAADASIALGWMLLCYLLLTLGELCISPVGLSVVSELAPEAQTNVCMGAWFMTYAAGHLVAGWIAAATATAADTATGSQAEGGLEPFAAVFGWVGLAALGLGLLLLLLTPWLVRLIGAPSPQQEVTL